MIDLFHTRTVTFKYSLMFFEIPLEETILFSHIVTIVQTILENCSWTMIPSHSLEHLH